MRLLLDTHVVLWQLAGVQRLGVRASEAIASAAELAFSVVSFAEIGAKAAIGKLTVPGDLHAHVLGTGLRVLGLAPDHGLAVARAERAAPEVVGLSESGSKDDPGTFPEHRIRVRHKPAQARPHRVPNHVSNPAKSDSRSAAHPTPGSSSTEPTRTHGTSTGTSGRPRAAADTYRCRCA